jgi:hypothetical protein
VNSINPKDKPDYEIEPSRAKSGQVGPAYDALKADPSTAGARGWPLYGTQFQGCGHRESSWNVEQSRY